MGLIAFRRDFFDVLKKIMFTLKAIETVFEIKPSVLEVLNENFLLLVRKFLDLYSYETVI